MDNTETMNTKLQLLRLCALWGVLAFAGRGRSATVTMDFLAPGTSLTEDTRYNDGESMVLQTSHNGVIGRVSAANYSDDASSSDRWGLVDASKPWNRGKQGALIRMGIAPSAVGSTRHEFGAGPGSLRSTDASYISIRIERPSTTLFTDLRVDLLTSNVIAASTAWGGTSADGFTSVAQPGRPQTNSQGRLISWDFSNLNYTGTEPLEIRLYGLIGADIGTLKSLRVNIGATPIPEPCTMSLLVACAVMMVAKRTRHRSQESALLIASNVHPAK